MLFWVESLKFMMLPTCQSNFFFKFQKFAFFEFPNHNRHSTALCTDLFTGLCKLVKIGISYPMFIEKNPLFLSLICSFDAIPLLLPSTDLTSKIVCFWDTYITQRFFPTYSFTALCKLVKVVISYL